MANLLSELEAVVRLQDEYDTSFDDEARIAIGQREDTLASNFLRTHHAEIAAAVRDKRRVDFIEQKAADGWCPGLINDDNGHWAWSDSGIQPVPDGDDSQTMATTFFVEADQWKPTLREAIDAVMNDDAAMSAREGQG